MLSQQRQETSHLRRRRQESNQVVEPLDEDDQARMVEQLRHDTAQQQESIVRLFTYLCFVAAGVLILSVVYLDQWYLVVSNDDVLLRGLSMGHGVSSAVLHGVTPPLTRPRRQGSTSLVLQWAVAVDTLVAVAVLWACRRQQQQQSDDDPTLLWMHYGIAASNVFIVLVAVLLKWDAQSTDKALKELVQAQYRYKSL